MKWSYVWGSILTLCLLSGLVMGDISRGVPVVQIPQVSGSIPGDQPSQPAFREQVSALIAQSENQGLQPEAINYITAGTTVFIGEQYLEISTALGEATAIAWWNSTPVTSGMTNPDAVVQVSEPHAFFIDPALFVGKTGNWYKWQNNCAGPLVLKVEDPSIRLIVWDATIGEDVTGKTIPAGHFANFRIDSNLYSIMNRTGVQPADGPIKITVTGPSNETYDLLIGANDNERPLTHLAVNSPLWYWIGEGDDHTKYPTADGWNTTVINPFTSGRIYNPGVYTIRAACNANKMKETYKAPDGSDYVNKTVTANLTVELVDNVVAIEVDKDHIYPGESFKTAITGLPNAEYHLWVKNTSYMTGLSGDQPPSIANDQHRVYMDDPAGPYEIGSYVFSDGGGKTIRQDVTTGDPWVGTRFYATVKLDPAGSLIVSWNTSSDTAPGTFTLAVEAKTDTGYTTDTGFVTVDTEGLVSINRIAAKPYFSDEIIDLSGCNEVSGTTYLFMTGQNLPVAGGSLSSPNNPVISDQPASFTTALVSEDNTWNYTWKIPWISEKGKYTVYVTAYPKNLTDINQTPYGALPINLIPHSSGEQLELLPGWNFISTPYVLKNGSDTMAIFSGVNSSGHSILGYNVQTSSWNILKAHDPFMPLNSIWIYSEGNCSIPLDKETGTLVPQRALSPGWNTLGIASPDRPVSQALVSIQTIWSYLVRYDAAMQKYRDPIINSNHSDETVLKTKEGFWIYMKQNGTFTG